MGKRKRTSVSKALVNAPCVVPDMAISQQLMHPRDSGGVKCSCALTCKSLAKFEQYKQ